MPLPLHAERVKKAKYFEDSSAANMLYLRFAFERYGHLFGPNNDTWFCVYRNRLRDFNELLERTFFLFHASIHHRGRDTRKVARIVKLNFGSRLRGYSAVSPSHALFYFKKTILIQLKVVTYRN